MRLLPALLLAGSVLGQVTAAFAPAGQEVERAFFERRVKGVAIWSVSVCADAAQAGSTRITSSDILRRAMDVHLVLFPPAVLDAVGARIVARSPAARVADIAEGLTLAGGGLTSGGTIKAGPAWTTALILASGSAHWLAGKLQPVAPTLAKLRALELPDAVDVAPGGCWAGAALGAPVARGR